MSLLVVGMFLVGCVKSSEEGLAGQAVQKSCPVCNSGWQKYCGSLLEGQSQAYTIASSSYSIQLKSILYQDYAGGVHSAAFRVNGKAITLLEGEEKQLSDGKFMTLNELVFQDYAGGVHSASFCLSG